MAIELPPVPFERFLAFHESFDGERNGMWNSCAQCGGRCEQYKIGTLLPGEKEFIATQVGISVTALEAGYLDRLVTPRGTVDVLKLAASCPFLDTCYHCTLAAHKVKPVLCEAYPVVFEVDQVGGTEQDPELEVRFLIDEIDCPLVHLTYQWGKRSVYTPQWKAYRDYFENTAVERLRQVRAPAAWYWIVAQYDAENFDQQALARVRKVPVNHYATFTLDEIMSCRVGQDPCAIKAS